MNTFGDIEKSIRTAKERVRCGFHSMSYTKFRKLMKISLVQDMFTCLKMFPYKNGISSKLGPAAITLGYPNRDHNKLKTIFGSYAQVFIGTMDSNNQITVGGISLRLENKWGGYTHTYGQSYQ